MVLVSGLATRMRDPDVSSRDLWEGTLDRYRFLATNQVHSPKLTWNLKRTPSKRTVACNSPLFRLHVCLAECVCGM